MCCEFAIFYDIRVSAFGQGLSNPPSSSPESSLFPPPISISSLLPFCLGSVLLLTVLWNFFSFIFALIDSKSFQPMVNCGHGTNKLCKNAYVKINKITTWILNVPFRAMIIIAMITATKARLPSTIPAICSPDKPVFGLYGKYST